MELTVGQIEYLRTNGIPEPTGKTLELLYRASQLDRIAITSLLHAGWFWVELAKITGRTVIELQNA